jgi:hypothetical protein
MPIFDFLSHLEEEYMAFKRLSDTKPDLLFSNPSILLTSKDLPFQYRQDVNDAEHMRLLIHTFIVTHITAAKLSQLQAPELLDQVLNATPLYQEGQEIVLSNRTLHYCRLQTSFLTVTGRTLPQQQQVVHVQQAKGAKPKIPQHASGTLPRYLTFENEHMFILESNLNKTGYGIVRQAVPLLYLKTADNAENNFTLRLIAEKKQRGSNATVKLCDETLVFEDALQCKQVRQAVESQVTNAISRKKRNIKLLFFGTADVPDFQETEKAKSNSLPKSELGDSPASGSPIISSAKYYTK